VLSVGEFLRLWGGTGLAIVAPGVGSRAGIPSGVVSALSIFQGGAVVVAFTRIDAVLAKVGAKAMGPTVSPARVEGGLVHWLLLRVGLHPRWWVLLVRWRIVPFEGGERLRGSVS
jgi:hypothetical protein